MSAWWPIVAVFWFWYLADCVRFSRHACLCLAGALGRGRGRVTHGCVAVLPPVPTGWHVRAEDLPLSFSPAGLCNLPVGSAGRPAPSPAHPRAWRWEEIRQLSVRGGRVYVNGELFCEATALVAAGSLRALIEACKAGTLEEREAMLSARVRGWFGFERARRQLRLLAGCTRGLSVWACVGAALALVLSVYLLSAGYLQIKDGYSLGAARLLPLMGLYLAGLHGCLVVAGWRAHRRLMPTRKQERFSLLVSAFFLPPQAYRLRSRIGAEYLEAAHPLAWIAAGASQGDFVRYAKQALTDLHWPVPWPGDDGARADLAVDIRSWMAERVAIEMRRMLDARGVAEACLLAAPAKDCGGSRAYCPRCGCQFTQENGRCPLGIALKKF